MKDMEKLVNKLNEAAKNYYSESDALGIELDEPGGKVLGRGFLSRPSWKFCPARSWPSA